MRSRSATAAGVLIVLTSSLLLSACSRADQTGAVAASTGPTGQAEPAPAETGPPPPAPTLSIPPTAKPTSRLKREVDQKSHFILPNLVGRNLQAAQNLLQTHNSYLFHEVDATGQGRRQVRDRDWKVCSQKPAAGTRVTVVRIITVGAVKLSESCP